MPYEIDATYAQLRQQAFAWTDERAPAGAPSGLIMETGYPNAIFTLVALSDGTASLYFSTGGGLMNAQSQEGPAKAALALAHAARRYVGGMPAAANTSPPERGEVKLYVLTNAGPRGVGGPEAEFAEDRRPQSPLFKAAHALLAEIGKLKISS